MSAKFRLPPGLQTATFVVAVLTFGVLTVGVGLTAALQDLAPAVATQVDINKS
jgi:hypothetical protein